jgi:tetratricopeptide (TPR) repeat protein
VAGRRSVVCLVAISLAAGALQILATPQDTGPWEATAAEHELANEVHRLLDAAREAAGIGTLGRHPNLDRLAYQHAREMALRGSVTHHSHMYGIGTRTRIELAFPNVYQFGENVAVNLDPSHLHSALMTSRGHRLNRMDASFTHVGMGVARAGEHQLYLAEVFVRVFDTTPLERIDVLYTAVSPATLPDEDPSRGEIVDEVVRVGSATADNPEYWTQLGIDAYHENRFGAAVEHFTKALELQPDYEYAQFNLARAYLGTGEPARSLELLKQQLARDPEDLDLWSSAGTALLLLQRFDEAVEAFTRVLRVRARDAGSWYNLGLAYEMQEHLEDAERAYRQALHVDPASAAATAGLARVTR